MNYLNHYNLLIEKAKRRETLNCYTESHHILPRCLGGTDDYENLVDLTAREHYIAHLLLVKIHPDNPKLVYAANMMCVDSNGQRINNKRYAWLKEEFSKVHSNRMKGHIQSEETIRKRVAKTKGLKRSLEYRQNLSKRQVGRTLSEETKAKIGLANTGTKWSEEAKEAHSIRLSGSSNAMYGLKGKDHPAYGNRPWEVFTSRDRSGYMYADTMYTWYHNTLKTYKVAGHKRFLKETNLDLPESLVRNCLKKISEGWNPSEDREWLDWKNQ